MGDPLKKVQAGDPLKITATAYNAFVDAANANTGGQIDKGPLSGGSGGHTPPTIVRVTNKSTDEGDWPIWTPVIVCVPEGTPVEYAQQFIGSPYFPGYRPDDSHFTGYAMLGITQEPIANGKTGRVCIYGVTPALMQKTPSGWTGTGNYEWVHARKFQDRWTLRNGPAGDARLLQILDTDLYEDGTYNDQYLVLIDLSTPKNRHIAYNWTGDVLPAHSVNRNGYKVIDTTSQYLYPLGNSDLAASCGWDVPNHQMFFNYRFSYDIPVIACTGDWPSTTADPYGIAAYELNLQLNLPGLLVVTNDWCNYSEGAPYYSYVRRNVPGGAYVKMEAAPTGYANGWVGFGWPCEQYTASWIFDGIDHGGLTLPEVKFRVFWPNCHGGSGWYLHPKTPNVSVGDIIAVMANPQGVGNAAGDYCLSMGGNEALAFRRNL
jgi:hypothetical protein